MDCADYVRLQTALTEIGGKAETIYPNPTNGRVQIAVQNQVVYALTISDALGRVIKQLNSNNHNPLTELNLTELPNGIYFCSFYTASGSKAHKLVKKE